MELVSVPAKVLPSFIFSVAGCGWNPPAPRPPRPPRPGPAGGAEGAPGINPRRLAVRACNSASFHSNFGMPRSGRPPRTSAESSASECVLTNGRMPGARSVPFASPP